MRNTATATRVLGVRFYQVGKVYHFDSAGHPLLGKGDRVIVDTKRGRQLGEVVSILEAAGPAPRGMTYKPIVRAANPADLMMREQWQTQELDCLINCREKAAAIGIKGVKFIKAEYNYDGSQLSIFYNEDEDKPPAKLDRLAQDLERIFPNATVYMQQIGPRDVAKLLGGYGACSGPRCCSTFLTEFSPISIKMAKAQGISLNQEDITGMCGRLRCCLIYEYEQYVEARKGLPKMGKRIGTPHGIGRVIDVQPLRGLAVVDVDGERHEVTREDLQPLEELEALKRKAAAGCSKHEGGGCDCGAKKLS